MVKFDVSKLSTEMKKDLISYEKSGQDAMYLLGNGISFDKKTIITRLQTSIIDEMEKLGYKSASAWKNSGSYLTDIDPLQTPLTSDGSYSSFALREREDSIGRIRYPLVNSFASAGILFTEKRFPLYTGLIRRVEDKYKVKVIELSYPKKLYQFKKSKTAPLFKGISRGFRNLKRVVLRKTRLASEPVLNGKIRLGAQVRMSTDYVYKVSQQEKFASVMDTISRHTIRHFAKKEGSNLTRGELFFGRLYAEVLLARAINFGDKESNRSVESCLTLQMSNVLAKLEVSPDRIQKAVELGEKTAMDIINRLDLSFEEVRQSVLDAGYKFREEPKSFKEALLPCQTTTSHFENYEQVEEEIAAEETLIKDKKDLPAEENIKDDTQYITKKSVEKYIDSVIDKSFKKQAESATNQIFNESSSQKKVERMQRKYNFIDHMQSFYERHKACSSEEIKEVLEQEKLKELDDLFYAHSFSNSFIELKKFIIDSLFGDKDSIEKTEGMAAAALVNGFTNDKYSKALSTYVNESISKTIVDIFKEIDSKTFAPKDITVVKEKE